MARGLVWLTAFAVVLAALAWPVVRRVWDRNTAGAAGANTLALSAGTLWPYAPLSDDIEVREPGPGEVVSLPGVKQLGDLSP